MKQSPKIKVAICVPSGDMVHTDFAMCLVNLVSYSFAMGLDLVMVNSKSSHIDMGRHSCIKSALTTGADYVLFLDSDMTFPHDTLYKLLAHGHDIVGAAAVRRRPPHTLVHTEFADDDGRQVPPTLGNAPRQVARVGTACLLVRLSVFKVIPEPWFDSRWDAKAMQRISEDNAFCDDARRMGFPVYLDPGLRIGHIGCQTFYPEDSSHD